MADPNAINFLCEAPMPNRDYGLATEDAMPRRKPRTIGGSMLDLLGSTNALANVAGAPPDSGQSPNALNPGSVLTPFGWMPTGLASQLADYLTPSRRDVADTLGAPVDAASYWLHRIAGLNIPTTTPSSSTHT